MNGLPIEIEALLPILFCFIVFSVMYILLHPLAKWIVQARASRLLAYLASGSFCLVILFSCMVAIPDFLQRYEFQLPLQYFAYFGLGIGILSIIRGKTRRGTQAVNYKGRQSGQ